MGILGNGFERRQAAARAARELADERKTAGLCVTCWNELVGPMGQGEACTKALIWRETYRSMEAKNQHRRM